MGIIELTNEEDKENSGILGWTWMYLEQCSFEHMCLQTMINMKKPFLKELTKIILFNEKVARFKCRNGLFQ